LFNICHSEPDQEIVHAIEKAQKPVGKPILIQQTPCPQVNMSKIVFVMVGLPARGKSYIARLLSKYLNWLGVNCRGTWKQCKFIDIVIYANFILY